MITLFGFSTHNVKTAMHKYFDYYKIKADLSYASLKQFEHPIYLRIFCEVENPARSVEKQIFIGEKTLFEIFDRYLNLCNEAICERLGLSIIGNNNFLSRILSKLCEHLWQNHERNI